jgi:type IV pilus secretin PilQ/predicted competence protein
MIKSKGIRKSAVAIIALVVVIGFAGGGWAQADKPIKSLSFQNADVRSVINFLSEYSGINMVAAPAVEGDVTLNVHDVTWEQALNILVATYGLHAVHEKGYVRIMRAEDFQQEEDAREQHDANKRRLVRTETRIIEIQYAAATDMIKPIKSIMTTRGKVDVDRRTNSLIVTDEPINIAAVADFVKELDRETRQIRIEAKLMEVSTDYLEEIGLDWWVSGTGTGGDDNQEQYDNTINIGGAAGRVSDAFLGYNFRTLQRGWNLDATIEAIVSNGKGKVIAHPEITTVDNKEARIQMGQRIPIKEFDASGNVIITFTEVGTILRVTPHITAEDRILMHLRPERSTYEFDPNGVIISTNNAETHVVVENNQTAVIGGLTTQDELTLESGVPLLKDIPFIGRLFKYKKKQIESRDLIIFVTPTIVDTKMMGSVETGP